MTNHWPMREATFRKPEPGELVDDSGLYWCYWYAPGFDSYSWEAYLNMTEGGCHVHVNETPEPRSPWGIFRFREYTPPGGLILRSWDDN